MKYNGIRTSGLRNPVLRKQPDQTLVAGIGYGWAYRRTGRIEASILTHFSLNSLHFLLFTYPALAASMR